MSFNSISIIGLGYIGLPTAAMFASKGIKVIGVDINQQTVDTINAGKIHIIEPKLDEMIKKAVDGRFLKATTTPEPADAFLIAVPTPFSQIRDQGSVPKPNLSYIKSAAKSVGKVLKKGDIVILESTSPVGTTEQMSEWLAEERSDLTFPHTHGEDSDIRVAYCPERVLPGHVIKELIKNDRIIGGMTQHCSTTAIKLYKIFVEGECIASSARTAEMAKLTENASRDVGIAFANELSMICDKLQVDVWELIELANRHPRVNILKPGPGVGGHCIAVDPWFIVSETPEEAILIKTARMVNDAKPHWVLNKVKIELANFLQKYPAKKLNQVVIACYGLAFKPDIDDLRESPALNITNEIASMHKGQVLAVEPNIKSINTDSFRLATIDEAISMADIHLMLVDHKEFKEISLSSEFIIDTKGIWS